MKNGQGIIIALGFMGVSAVYGTDLEVSSYTCDSFKRWSAHLLSVATSNNTLTSSLADAQEDLAKIQTNIAILNDVGTSISGTLTNADSWANLVQSNGDASQTALLAGSVQIDMNANGSNTLAINNYDYKTITSIIPQEQFYVEFFQIVRSNFVTNTTGAQYFLDFATATRRVTFYQQAQELEARLNGQIAYFSDLSIQINDNITRLKGQIAMNCSSIGMNNAKISQYVSQ